MIYPFLENRETAIYHILIDHVLIYIPDDMKALIVTNNVEIQYRRDDTQEPNRVSDHWLVNANLSFFPSLH